MAQISISKCNELTAVPQRILEQMRDIAESIRQRAFGLFQSRNGVNGSDVDDWLQAEREVVWSPPAELIDEEKEFKARVALPGFDANEIHVSAMPDAVVVQADSTHTHEGSNGNVRFCEFSGKQLYRRLDLPGSVDVDKVTASLDKGILQVILPKLTEKQIAAAA